MRIKVTFPSVRREGAGTVPRTQAGSQVCAGKGLRGVSCPETGLSSLCPRLVLEMQAHSSQEALFLSLSRTHGSQWGCDIQRKKEKLAFLLQAGERKQDRKWPP